MTDVKVEQCDINEAEEFRDILDSADAEYPSYAINVLAEILARHRQAAEKATREAVERAYKEERHAANEQFREGITSYQVLKATVNTAARMRDAAIRSHSHE